MQRSKTRIVGHHALKTSTNFLQAGTGFFVTVATETYDNVTKFIKDSER